MGWRNQHDFKVIFGATILIGMTLISSCSLFYNYDKVEDSKETKVIKVKNDGKVYLVNWNRDYDYLDNETISVSNIKEREVENPARLPTMTEARLSDADYFKAKFDKDNKDFVKNLINKKGRSASYNMSVKKITAKKGDLLAFWIWELEDQQNGTYKNKWSSEFFTCKYVGQHCVVWYAPINGVVATDQDCQNLGKKFDVLYEKEVALIGTHQYETSNIQGLIPSQDKIDLVFYDINKDDEDGYVLGYQMPADCLKQSYIETMQGYDTIYNNHSNDSQAIYLDTWFFKQNETDIYSTLVHEFNHLLNFCQKDIMRGIETDTWYTEMLSMLVEDCFQEYLDIPFISSPKIRLQTYMMDYGYSASPFDWFDVNSEYVGYSYASTYAMGSYFARNFGGIDLIHEIATNDYVNETSIATALSKLGYSDDKLSKTEYFYKALYNEPYILINTEAKSKEKIDKVNKNEKNEYFTLNRKWTSDKFSDLSLEPIEIGKSVEVNYQGQKRKLKFTPNFMKIDELYSGGNYRKAYSIVEIGEGIKEFKVETTSDYKGVYNVFYPQPVK